MQNQTREGNPRARVTLASWTVLPAPDPSRQPGPETCGSREERLAAGQLLIMVPAEMISVPTLGECRAQGQMKGPTSLFSREAGTVSPTHYFGTFAHAML